MTPASFVQPVGELSPDLFPLTDRERAAGTYADEEAKLTALLTTWLTEAAAKAPGHEAAQAQWVLYRAKRSVYTRLAAQPSSYSAGEEGSVSYTQGQRDAWAREAAEHLAEFEALTVGRRARAPLRTGTGVVPTSTVWG